MPEAKQLSSKSPNKKGCSKNRTLQAGLSRLKSSKIKKVGQECGKLTQNLFLHQKRKSN